MDSFANPKASTFRSLISILGALIGHENVLIDKYLKSAQDSEIQLVITQRALYCATFSVRETDTINSQRFALLLQFAEILLEEPEYLGAGQRDRWRPTENEVANWRKCALEFGDGE
jgi:hypothetical protein